MTDPEDPPGRVQTSAETPSMQEVADGEIEALASEIAQLAEQVRDRASLMSEKDRAEWIQLDAKVGEYRRDVERHTRLEIGQLRRTGFEQKRKLRHFLERLKV